MVSLLLKFRRIHITEVLKTIAQPGSPTDDLCWCNKRSIFLHEAILNHRHDCGFIYPHFSIPYIFGTCGSQLPIYQVTIDPWFQVYRIHAWYTIYLHESLIFCDFHVGEIYQIHGEKTTYTNIFQQKKTSLFWKPTCPKHHPGMVR